MFAPAYGAPEQFDETVGAIGPWTDVYALALVVLEALTNRTAMEGERLGEFALKALDGMNRPTPRSVGVSVGDDVEAVMARAVAISPSTRPSDAGQFWGMLKHAMSVRHRLRAGPSRHGRSERAAAADTFRIPVAHPRGDVAGRGGGAAPSAAPPAAQASRAPTRARCAWRKHRSLARPPRRWPRPRSPCPHRDGAHCIPCAPLTGRLVVAGAHPAAARRAEHLALRPDGARTHPLGQSAAHHLSTPLRASGRSRDRTAPEAAPARALVIVVVVVILGALAGGWWVVSGRSHSQVAPPASSSGG